ncbi:hypothetical protein DFH11DRAFT_1746553 [Phellopilus nigrolimitatus]|nr:hypothetical protein DFH11DRAFT_1746553 [Phellopilus nigrolimitatus]
MYSEQVDAHKSGRAGSPGLNSITPQGADCPQSKLIISPYEKQTKDGAPLHLASSKICDQPGDRLLCPATHLLCFRNREDKNAILADAATTVTRLHFSSIRFAINIITEGPTVISETLAYILFTSENLDTRSKLIQVASTAVLDFEGVWKTRGPYKALLKLENGIITYYELHTAVKLNKMPLSQEHSMSVFDNLYCNFPDFNYEPLKDYLAHVLAFLSQDSFNFLDKPKDMTNDELARNLIKLAEEEIEGDGRVISLSELGEKK